MTMSAIFLVHTIAFLLLLQPTLHLADSREDEAYGGFSSSTIPGGGGGGMLDGRNNKTTPAVARGMDGHHFGMLTNIMTGTTRPANTLPVIHGHRHAGSVTVVGVPSEAASPARPSFIPPSAQSITHGRYLDDQAVTKEGPLEPLFLPSSSRIIGPYFESNRTIVYMTVRAGEKVLMNCDVALLQGRTVSWLRRRKDSLQLLTVGNATYSSDGRLGLHFRYPSNWRLGILNVNKRDEGEYQCQLSTHPPKALIFHLKVIAPAVQILDENGNVVTERHYKVDSSLHLTCKASHLDKLVDHIGWFKGSRALPGGDSRIKVKSLKNTTNGESAAFLSVLSVRKGDSGNYTCRASPVASSTIAVHVLNGELPAAVQHENSANVLRGSYFLYIVGLGASSITATALYY